VNDGHRIRSVVVVPQKEKEAWLTKKLVVLPKTVAIPKVNALASNCTAAKLQKQALSLFVSVVLVYTLVTMCVLLVITLCLQLPKALSNLK
tara:strand:- start:92 stop:364 length:273 start_codon:yes stop_codon:yes gene_type:complete